MAKLSAPNPAIFTTDPIEQVFARGVANRDNTAGLNASWLLAFGKDRSDNQDKYMGALHDANVMDASLAQQEALLKLREQGMKSATDLIKEGFMPSSMQSGRDLFSDVPSGDQYAKMLQALTQSKINKNNQPPGAGSGKPTTTVQSVMMPWGAAGPTTITSKAPDPGSATTANSAALANVVQKMKENPSAYTADQKKQVMQLLMQQTNQRQPGIED